MIFYFAYPFLVHVISCMDEIRKRLYSVFLSI